jgi:hypothetical protein
MAVDSNFIKNLIIPFNEVLPPGSLQLLRDTFSVSEHTPRKALKGEFYNEEITKAALRQIAEHQDLLQRFIEQFPPQFLKEALADAASA